MWQAPQSSPQATWLLCPSFDVSESPSGPLTWWMSPEVRDTCAGISVSIVPSAGWHFTLQSTRGPLPLCCPLYSHCVLYSQFIEIHHSPQGGAEVPRPHFYQTRPRISRGTKLMERFVFVTDWERRVTRVTPFLFCVYSVCYMLQSYIMDIVLCIPPMISVTMYMILDWTNFNKVQCAPVFPACLSAPPPYSRVPITGHGRLCSHKAPSDPPLSGAGPQSSPPCVTPLSVGCLWVTCGVWSVVTQYPPDTYILREPRSGLWWVYLCFRERLWPTMEDQRQYCLKWNNHPTNISSVFDRLRSEELFVDVTLASQDRQVSYELWVRDLLSSFLEFIWQSFFCHWKQGLNVNVSISRQTFKIIQISEYFNYLPVLSPRSSAHTAAFSRPAQATSRRCWRSPPATTPPWCWATSSTRSSSCWWTSCIQVREEYNPALWLAVSHPWTELDHVSYNPLYVEPLVHKLKSMSFFLFVFQRVFTLHLIQIASCQQHYDTNLYKSEKCYDY